MKFVQIGHYVFNADCIKRLAVQGDYINVVDDECHTISVKFDDIVQAKKAYEQVVRDLTWSVPMSITSTGPR